MRGVFDRRGGIPRPRGGEDTTVGCRPQSPLPYASLSCPPAPSWAPVPMRQAIEARRRAGAARATPRTLLQPPPPPCTRSSSSPPPPAQVFLPTGDRAPQDRDGAYILSDDTRLLSDGSLKRPDGRVVFPDGSVKAATGELHLTDGRVLPVGSSPPCTAIAGFAPSDPLPPGQFPDFPKGTVKLRDGSHKLPNGMVYFSDGRYDVFLSGRVAFG